MEIRNPQYFPNRQALRKWLKKNFNKEKELWLIFPKKDSGLQRIPYNDAVEEALCFGWIDSTVKPMDENQYAQRFTPRNPKSVYSQPNKERIRWLAAKGLLHPNIVKDAQYIFDEIFIFPEDIIEVLKKDKVVWQNFNNFSEAYRRIRISYINGARSRPDEFNKRLENFIEKTRYNKMIGFGGIEKYY